MGFKEYYLEEGIMNWIMPLVLATAVVAKGDDSIVTKMQDSETAKAVKHLVDTTPREWEKIVKMASLVKRFSKIDDNLKDVLEAIGEDAGEIMQYIQDQKFEIVVNEDMDSMMEVDVDDKIIYVKDIKLMDSLKELASKGIVQQKQEEVVEEAFKRLLNIKGEKILVDIKDLDLKDTIHSSQRGIGRKIPEKEILDNLEFAVPYILNDFANGEIPNNAEFLIRNKETNLNIIATLTMKKGTDEIRVITVMRKKDFIPKRGTYKYEV